MAAFDLPGLAAIGEDEIARFRRDGFLVVERILSEERIAALRERFPLLLQAASTPASTRTSGTGVKA